MANLQIVIVGFMGSGKTTVAYALARKLNSRAVDLDELITQRETRGPKEIIERDGEEAFRTIESKLLHEVLVGEFARVLAVGGGAWTIADNRKVILEHESFTVWLDAPFELCWQRIEAGREVRPLARSRELAQTLYEARLPIYALADERVHVSEDESAEEIAAKVARIVLRQSAKS